MEKNTWLEVLEHLKELNYFKYEQLEDITGVEEIKRQKELVCLEELRLKELEPLEHECLEEIQR